uniref:EF-hand domain-containing protein n=1 Tax=Strigops habroptila TaxID=2489341 RepID=A0A672TFQ0_STRHB
VGGGYHLQGRALAIPHILLTLGGILLYFFLSPGNGYIEGKELENFFQELESTRKGVGNNNLGDKMKEFMHKYNKNTNGKIEMAELTQILPTEENFLLYFHQHVSSSSEFMEVSRAGSSTALSFQGYLSDLLKKANRPYDDGTSSQGTTVLPGLLPVQENFLLKFQGMKWSSKEFNAIFTFYDKDGSGFINENELDVLLKDLYEKNKKEMSIQQLTNYRKNIMNLSNGGKLYHKELEIVLCSKPPM